MPGVLRPYTLVDVLSTINNQNGVGNTNPTVLTVPLSEVGEVDEAATMGDSAFASSQTNITWDQGVWSAGSWS